MYGDVRGITGLELMGRLHEHLRVFMNQSGLCWLAPDVWRDSRPEREPPASRPAASCQLLKRQI